MNNYKQYVDINGVGVIFEIINECLDSINNNLGEKINDLAGEHKKDREKILDKLNTTVKLYKELYKYFETELGNLKSQESNLTDLINKETVRAMDKENILEGLIKGNANQIEELEEKYKSLKKEMKQTLDKIIYDGFTDELDSFREIANYLKEHGDAFEELKSAFNDLKIAIETEKKIRVEKVNALTEKLDSEISRATAKEDELNDLIASNKADTEAKFEEMTNSLSEEQTRAEEAEKALGDLINTEKIVRVQKVNELKEALESEVARAEAKENELLEKIHELTGDHEEEANAKIEEINKLISELQTTTEELQANIDAEAKAREEADNALTEALNKFNEELEAEIEEAKKSLQESIDNEAKTRQEEDEKLDEAIKVERDARYNGDLNTLQSAKDYFNEQFISSDEISDLFENRKK